MDKSTAQAMVSREEYSALVKSDPRIDEIIEVIIDAGYSGMHLADLMSGAGTVFFSQVAISPWPLSEAEDRRIFQFNFLLKADSDGNESDSS